jgi:hypothetical protein
MSSGLLCARGGGTGQIIWIRTTLWGEEAVLPKTGKSKAMLAFKSRIFIDLCG